jgi:hypothetical protein
MPDVLDKADLLDRLRRQVEVLGLKRGDDGPHGVSGEVESIKSKWWFGGRKVTYRMSCALTDADHVAHFREVIFERSWGMPPPTLTFETTSISGTRLSGQRHDFSIGSGGTLDSGRVRQSIEQTVCAGGWSFRYESGRMP